MAIIQHFEKDGYAIQKIFYSPAMGPVDPATVTAADLLDRPITESYVLTKTKGADDIYIGNCTATMCRYGRTVFKKSRVDEYLLYRNGKLVIGKQGVFSSIFIQHVIDFFRRECFYLSIEKNQDTGEEKRFVDNALTLAMSNKTVLEKVVKGKITNRRDLMTAYLSSSWKIKASEVPIAVADEFFQESYMTDVEIGDLRDFTTSLAHAMEVALHGDTDRKLVFRDLLKDAVKLDIRINPRWSLRRMKEEHIRNIRIIMEHELTAKSDENIYGDKTLTEEQEDFTFAAIDTERSAFMESKTMEHCVYTHYWKNEIAQGRYFALHMHSKKDDDKDYTVGIIYGQSTNEIVIDQIHGYRNCGPSENARQKAKAFCDTHAADIIAMMKAARGRYERDNSCAFVGGQRQEPNNILDELPF